MNTDTPPPIPDSPLAKNIEAIKASLRCFVYSLVGLVPVAGLPFSLAAIVQSRQVERAARSDWNPAEGYLKAAHRIGPLGFLTTAACLFAIFVVLPGFSEGLKAWTCARGST
jgi:hypothetical protein